MWQRDAPCPVRGRAPPGSPVEVSFRGHIGRSRASPDGRWEVVLPPLPPGGPDPLEARGWDPNGAELGPPLRGNVRLGDVWVCLGQSNMAYTVVPYPPWTEGLPDWEREVARARIEGLHLLAQPRFACEVAWPEVAGRWRTCRPKTVAHFSAIAYSFGRALREADPTVPVGVITAAIGSTALAPWLPEEAVLEFPDLAAEQFLHRRLGEESATSGTRRRDAQAAYVRAFQRALEIGERPPNLGPEPWETFLHQPAGCYRAIVHPLTRYPVRGWVWYQGEGNTARPHDYARQLQALIAAYRQAWHQPTAPFLVVQLPGYDPSRQVGADPASPPQAWAILREQQRQAVAQTPGTALIATLDLGDPDRIHPREKRPVGERCARAALALTGRWRGDPPAPLPVRAVWLPPERLEVRFATPPRWPAGADSVAGLEILYENRGEPIPTLARPGVEGLVLATDPAGGQPLGIRYAWANHPLPTLFTRAGEPIPTFQLPVLLPHPPP